jgi:hypothetical protein
LQKGQRLQTLPPDVQKKMDAINKKGPAPQSGAMPSGKTTP